MSIPVQDLITQAQLELGGYANAVTTPQLLIFLNQGKDELWALLKTLEQDYFMQSSQSTDSTKDNYFAGLTTATREYTLPSDFHESRFIEVTTSGYEDLRFVYRAISHPDFQLARRNATQDGAASGSLPGVYYYTIVGKNTFMLAQYPEATLNLTLWYIRAIPDFDTGDTLDEVLSPFSKKLVDFAVKKAMLIEQDQTQFAAWSGEWKTDIQTTLQAAAPREATDPQFVSDYLGW